MGSPSQPRCLSVVMPCYNEAERVSDALAAVLRSPFVAEVVVVDDGSVDATAKLVEAVAKAEPRVRLIRQPCNLGKGAALRRGFAAVSGEYVIVQDADLEYDPRDWPTLLQPLMDGVADVVYGSRFHASQGHRVLYYWHSVGNKLLTTLSNMATNLNLTDMETCSKAFRREVLQSIELHEDRFGFEPEITAKVSAGGWRVYEVGVTYNGRTYDEGKKIGWRDGVRAIWCIGRYSKPGERIAGRLNPTPRPASFDEADDHLATTLDALEGADAYADWVLSQFSEYLGGRILEVGAGTGTMTKRLAAHGQVVAVEPSERAAELLTSGFADDPRVEVVAGTLDDVADAPVFDNAVLINVLEHIPDDVGFLADLRTRLAPGGTVLCFVPAHPWLHSRFDDRVGHCRRYRRSTLAEVFGAAGFEIDQLRHVNAPGAVAWLAGARLLGMSPSARAAGVYQRTVLPLAQKVETGRELPFGQSLVAVARAASS